MTKRLFRTAARAEQPAAYPTLDEFDHGRRDFLGRLCAAALGAGALAALAGCGQRPVQNNPDGGAPPTDSQPPPDTRGPDSDSWGIAGGARPEDARIDTWNGKKPDAKQLEGDVAGPDARIDEIDAGSDPTPSPGFAPTMDARIDNGSCGNP
jgi:hypothetical protein